MTHYLDLIRDWLFWIVIGVVGFFALLLAGLFAAVLAASFWEKQRLRDFIPVPPESLPPLSPYFRAVTEAARAFGFAGGALLRQDRTNPTYRCYLGLWLATDQKSLLCIAGGKILGMPYRRMTITSMFPDGTSLVSTDGVGVEDISGLRAVDVLLNADLAELWEFHQSRLAAGGVEPRVLPVDNLYEELVEHNRVRADHLVGQGLAKYVSADRNQWRFTGKGARMNAVTNQTNGLARAQAQEQRRHRKRPGD